jgi:hypothetical protein
VTHPRSQSLLVKESLDSLSLLFLILALDSTSKEDAKGLMFGRKLRGKKGNLVKF